MTCGECIPVRVLNKREGVQGVYVGRPTKWGNPFVIGRDGSREEVIEKYRQYLESEPDLMDSLHELAGRDLVCHCAPLPCHADILLEYANEDTQS